MVDIFYSNGWKKPYCYTIVDMHKVLDRPINDENGIMDGGYYIYNWAPEHHIDYLLKSNFKFIMGFDGCPRQERKRLIELMIKNKKNIYPIIKSKNDWEWFLENKWNVEGISTANDEVIDFAYKKGLKIHHLGHIQNKDNLKKITTLDINPYSTTKKLLLDLGSDNIIKLSDDILKLGEFVLYGSSLYVDKPNDIDLLYYGSLSEEEINEIVRKINTKANVMKFTEEKYKTGKITHLLYAIDNGVKLNDCQHLMNFYDNFKGLSHGQYLNKCFLAANYYKDYLHDKEFKTLMIAYYYKHKTDLGKFLYDRLHLIYKIVGDGDIKAEMLFNRMLYSKFGRKFDLPIESRWLLYKHQKIEEIIDMFLPKVDYIYDEEKIMVKVK